MVTNFFLCLPTQPRGIHPTRFDPVSFPSNYSVLYCVMLCSAYEFCSGIAALYYFSQAYNNTIVRRHSFSVLCWIALILCSFYLIGPRPTDPRAHVEHGMLAHVIGVPLGLADVSHRRVLVLFFEAIVDAVLVFLDALGFLHATQQRQCGFRAGLGLFVRRDMVEESKCRKRTVPKRKTICQNISTVGQRLCTMQQPNTRLYFGCRLKARNPFRSNLIRSNTW